VSVEDKAIGQTVFENRQLTPLGLKNDLAREVVKELATFGKEFSQAQERQQQQEQKQNQGQKVGLKV
jgi:hypothetical protein